MSVIEIKQIDRVPIALFVQQVEAAAACIADHLADTDEESDMDCPSVESAYSILRQAGPTVVRLIEALATAELIEGFGGTWGDLIADADGHTCAQLSVESACMNGPLVQVNLHALREGKS